MVSTVGCMFTAIIVTSCGSEDETSDTYSNFNIHCDVRCHGLGYYQLYVRGGGGGGGGNLERTKELCCGRNLSRLTLPVSADLVLSITVCRRTSLLQERNVTRHSDWNLNGDIVIQSGMSTTTHKHSSPPKIPTQTAPHIHPCIKP